MSKFDSIESLERERVYSFRFCFINWITRGRLNKLLSKILIYLIRLRSNIKLMTQNGDMYITSSSMLEDIEIAIKFIYKIFEI